MVGWRGGRGSGRGALGAIGHGGCGERACAGGDATPALPMLDARSHCPVDYEHVLAELQSRLRQAVAARDAAGWFPFPFPRPLAVAVVGHGGRDTLGALAMVEAVARDELLRKRVDIDICSCS